METSRPTAPEFGSLLTDEIETGDGRTSISCALRDLDTDIVLACKDGIPAALWTAPHADAHAPHLAFSVSKSITGLAAGVAWAEGHLDLDAVIVTLVPECAGSGFGDATVRNLLDMQVSLDIDETYAGTSGFGARYCRAVLWDPPEPGEEIDHFGLLTTIGKGDEDHGGPFRYRSANSDMIGVVLERAVGQRFNRFVSDVLWEPMGGEGKAHVTVDRRGMAQSAGGISCTAFDLARLGEIMRCNGAVGGRQVLSPAFVSDTIHGGDAAAWRDGDWGGLLPGHRYRNQWYARGDRDGCVYAKGIHGQWLYINPRHRATIVKFSSQAAAADPELDAATLRLLDAIAERL
nr:serine hydrolase [Gymnodinialimonas phycosphaerae]